MDDTIQAVQIHGWRIQTPIQGEIQAFEGPDEGYFAIHVYGKKVVEIGVYHGDLVRISTAEGYAVQMIVDERFISVIETQ